MLCTSTYTIYDMVKKALTLINYINLKSTRICIPPPHIFGVFQYDPGGSGAPDLGTLVSVGEAVNLLEGRIFLLWFIMEHTIFLLFYILKYSIKGVIVART